MRFPHGYGVRDGDGAVHSVHRGGRGDGHGLQAIQDLKPVLEDAGHLLVPLETDTTASPTCPFPTAVKPFVPFRPGSVQAVAVVAAALSSFHGAMANLAGTLLRPKRWRSTGRHYPRQWLLLAKCIR